MEMPFLRKKSDKQAKKGDKMNFFNFFLSKHR